MLAIDKIASGAALFMQMSGGASVGIVTGNLLVSTTGGGNIPIDPALAAAYGAIGALFGLVTWLAKGRIERCENREDKILDSEAEKTTTIRELSQVTAKAAEVAAMATEESKKNGQKLDTLQSQFTTLATGVTELSRNVTGMLDNEARRR